MSPWTNRLQRRTRSLASFSGLKAVVAWPKAWGENSAPPVPRVATVATPAELSRKRRRLKEVLSVIVMSPWGRCRLGGRKRSGGEPVAAAGVEQVGAARIGNEMDGAARREFMPLAEYRRHVGRPVPAGDEGVGAGRLEHDHARRDAAARGELQVLGPGAEDDALAVAAAGVERRLQARAVGELE